MHITPHIVVRDAARAAGWYTEVLGAEERGRIEVPGGKLMQVELWFGDSALMLSDEFPEMGVLSPLSVGGTATVFHLNVDDVDAVWQRAVDGGADVRQPLADGPQSWSDPTSARSTTVFFAGSPPAIRASTSKSAAMSRRS
jgi:PhnB protein